MSKTTFRKKFLDLIMTERNFEEAFHENVSGELPISIKKQIKEAFNLPTDDCDIILKLYEENEQLKKKLGVMKSCHFNGCIGCNDKKCEVKE
jgi:hypothetical protein